jgi:four helix bundle protein
MLVKHYCDLWVYQRAFKTAMRIFELSKAWPSEERYSLTDQIRRSSRSVCGAISEAWRKRRYEAHFVSKLSDADGEAAETQNWLALALPCDYLAESDFRPLDDEYDAISAGLVSRMDNPSRWCGPGQAVREEHVATYGSVDIWACGRNEAPTPRRPDAQTPTRPDSHAPTPHPHHRGQT